MKYSKDIIEKIVRIQTSFRYKKELLYYLYDKRGLLSDLIFSIKDTINDKFQYGIIDQSELNDHFSKLEIISNKLCDINISYLSIIEFNCDIFRHYLKKMNEIINQLKNLVLITGINNISDILKLYDIRDIQTAELMYYNKIFKPINLKYYNEIEETEIKEKSLVVKDTSIIEIFSNIINKIENIDIEKYDKENIKQLNMNLSFRKIEGHKESVILSLFGCRMYLKYYNIIFAFDGYFKKDPLNLYRQTEFFKEKVRDIDKMNIAIPVVFKKAYLEQITIRDFILYDINELILQCQSAYSELNNLKQKTISSLVKDFLTSDFESQRRILTLFLLTEDDTDTQYLAYLMYDMITNESYLLKPQPLAEQVFNSLHWTVQKKFKVAINKVEKYTQLLIDFNETDIPYEKRICILKAPEYVKSKAMDKLKEINNRSNDSSVKAQQYLDGLLKIPFGIYIKEEIINYLTLFKEKYKLLIDKLVKNNISIEVNQNSSTSTDISRFFDVLDTNITVDDIIGYLENETTKEYKRIIKIINSYDMSNSIVISSKTKNILKNEIESYLHESHTSELLNNIGEQINFKPNIDDNINKSIQTLKIEWDLYQIEKKNYINGVRSKLDLAVYGHDEPKKQIERIIAQWINGSACGYCFGFEGPPGTGKTSLAKKGLTKCLADKNGNPRPFAFIPIGGSTNGSTLEGHCYTYVGSTWGRIVDVLMESRCMNPIIFIDELDKVSHTEHGKEIIGILTHLTDSSQNDEFIDKYFSGVKLDLSNALIIFSYNDPDLIDRILLDRIHRIRFKALTKQEKFHVCYSHVLPEIYTAVGINKDDIIFDKEILEFIIDNYTYEAGARKIREKIFEIVRELNLRNMCGETKIFPFTVTKDFITKDIFSERPKVIHNRISKTSRIGLVNGLYATGAGLGGITVIETFEIPSDNKFSLELTGQQGDVMKESMKVARTVAWNILPNTIKKKLYTRCEKENNFGIHIHCPEGGTPKDGPSAGGAITLAILSLLTKIPVKNTIGITGEIDLNGSIRAIGGLESKVDGAKKAGVKLVLCPSQNIDDVERIRNDKFTPVSDDFKIQTVDTIWDILKIALCDHNIKFNNYVKDISFES